MPFISTYFHNWDPIIFELGPLAVRWYGVAYLTGFIVAIELLKYLRQVDRYPIPKAEISNFIVMGGLFGVLLGGRLGYFLFYWLPTEGLDAWMNDFFVFIRFWDGGMASHGGIIGLMLYTLWYAKRHKLSWTGIGDGLCVVAPLGIFFGRIANFINGELYGRVVANKDTGMLFPGELFVPKDSGDRGWEALYQLQSFVPDALKPLSTNTYATQLNWLIQEARTNTAIESILREFCVPRYPSQLYQAAMEGLGLFLILFTIRMMFKNLRDGILTGIFFIAYAGFRILGESYREPDSALIGELTKGQFYSLFMVLIGLGFILWACRNKFQPTNN